MEREELEKFTKKQLKDKLKNMGYKGVSKLQRKEDFIREVIKTENNGKLPKSFKSDTEIWIERVKKRQELHSEYEYILKAKAEDYDFGDLEEIVGIGINWYFWGTKKPLTKKTEVILSELVKRAKAWLEKKGIYINPKEIVEKRAKGC